MDPQAQLWNVNPDEQQQQQNILIFNGLKMV